VASATGDGGVTSAEDSPGAFRDSVADRIELPEIRAFFVLADELHFGRTAARLGMTQPRVSQLVRTLEQRIGGPLFERSSRRVALTPLGELLRDRVRPVHEALRGALHDVREGATGVAGSLRVGVSTLMSGGPHLLDIIATFEHRHPAGRVELLDISGDLRFDRLRDDVDVLAMPLPMRRRGYRVGPVLSTEDRVVLLARAHPLAGRDSVTLEDLAGAVMISLPGLPTETVDTLFPATTPGGRLIHRGPKISSMGEVLSLVARGEIVHPTLRSIDQYYRHPGVVSVPLRDVPPIRNALVWWQQRHGRSTAAFVTVAREVLAGRDRDA
jgi:DNA-binding transcriptional LysR family regulator